MTASAEPVPNVLRVGLLTMCASRDVDENVANATTLVREAAAQGATYIQTPEFTTLMEMQSAKLFAATRPEANNPALAHFQSLARELKIWLHIGSMGVLVKDIKGGEVKAGDGQSGPDKIANRSFLISPEGTVVARYDKIHMFDAALGAGQNFRESKNFAPGAEAVVVELPHAILGLTVCYDLRFPGLYRALAKAGAQILAVPAAFERQTGMVHWHPLLKARAIESGAYILASTQGGKHACGRETYGHSIIISPWGEVIAEGGVEASVTFADIELGQVAEVRGRIPSLEHDRPFAIVRANAKTV